MCSKYVSVVAMMNVIPPITLTKYESSAAQIKEPKRVKKVIHSFFLPFLTWKNITLKNPSEVDPDRNAWEIPPLSLS